jgi:hypothetical protein
MVWNVPFYERGQCVGVACPATIKGGYSYQI